MILRARSVVTMDGAPIANGAVAIDENKIGDVGEWNASRFSGEVVDLGECALLPGLINAHCHLDYTGLRGKIGRPDSFADWIHAINLEKAKLSADNYLGSINDGFAEARRFGTTSIANLTGFPELISRSNPPIRTWWFAELIDIRDPTRAEKMVDDVRSLHAEINLAPHALYTASQTLFRRCAEAAERDDLLLTTHLAESAEEMQMFLYGEGSLAEFLRSISHELFEGVRATPVEYLAKICSLDDRWLLAHVNEMRESDLELLARAHIVHCPRSHAYFGHAPFQFSKMKARGLNICLGTDSLASNDDLSLFAEARRLRATNPLLSAGEILETLTINPARALRRESALGRLRSGYFADLIAVPCWGSVNNLFDEILAFEGSVPWMMIDGVVTQSA